MIFWLVLKGELGYRVITKILKDFGFFQRISNVNGKCKFIYQGLAEMALCMFWVCNGLKDK